MRSLLGLMHQPALLFAASDLRILESNTAARRFLGCSRQELLARDLGDLLAEDAGDIARKLARFVASSRMAAELSLALRCAQGECAVRLVISRLDRKSDLCCVSWRSQADGSRLPRRTKPVPVDPLTNLPTRAVWERRLARALRRSGDPGRRIALLFIDLDHFKTVNDVYGHQAGDRVLAIVAQRLLASVRPQDLVVRYGGDEFVILLEQTGRATVAAAAIARRICRAIRAPIQCDGRQIRVTASVGGRIARAGEASAQTLLGEADQAMYRAKADSRQVEGKGCWIVDEALRA